LYKDYKTSFTNYSHLR